MSIAKAYDVAFVRFSAPDLNRMREFLIDFGMVGVSNSESEVIMRGHGESAFCHSTELGEPGFKGFGIWLNSISDLEALAAHDNVPIEDFKSPGGGKCIKLIDPDGFSVEVIAGHSKVETLPTDKHILWNQAGEYPRQNDFRRVKAGPSHVMRLGHVVLSVSDFRASEAWYKERFGFVTSDEIQPAPDVAIGAFMRCDRGDEPCDHHTLFLAQLPGPPKFMHAAFEVVDFDDLMIGRDYLLNKEHKPYWGIGRHKLGSQIFDYWLDPWGHEVEHWTDGDQLVTADGGGIGTLEEVMSVQWGMGIPPMTAPPEE